MTPSFSQRLACRAVRALQRLGPRDVRVEGARLTVTRQVFNPRLFVTSGLLARHLGVAPGQAVLDVGTGSGVLAIVAARAAGRVVAVDVNPEAVRCARANAARNGVEVDVREGDLFAPLAPGERFDRILFNPPYMEGAPKDLLGAALHDPDKATVTRFLEGARAHLADGGDLRLVYSSIADPRRLLDIARSRGFAARVLARERTPLETYLVYRMTPRG